MNNLGKLVFGLVPAIALAMAPSPAHAQLQTVEQTVFGMDCAPCAYGLKKQMKSFDGVTSASVSLNEGLATLQLAQKNNLRLEKLRTAIEESGFSAREATVRVAGTLKKKGGQWVLRAPSGERFVLEGAGETSGWAAGERAVAAGTVPKGNASGRGWTLRVESVRCPT